MSKLQDKRALTAAGAQGIGLGIIRQLLAAGCDVFVHYRNHAGAARAGEFGPQVIRVNALAPGLIPGTGFHPTHTTKQSADATLDISGGVYSC